MVNNKIVVSLFLGILLIGCTVFFSIQSDKPLSFLDKRFDAVSNEIDNYGGAMIVKYDTETGEIISKRPAYSKEAGALTVRTQEEADQVLDKVPFGVEVFIVGDDVSPQRAIEFRSDN